MRVLIVEDETEIVEGLQRAFNDYEDSLEILSASNAGEAMEILYSESIADRPDGLVLDLMMSYGNAKDILDFGSDLDMIDTGVRLLGELRDKEKKDNHFFKYCPIFVAIITGRSDPQLFQKLKNLLGGWGKIYPKPFNIEELVNDMLTVFGLKSNVNEVLLPSNYTPPEKIYGDKR